MVALYTLSFLFSAAIVAAFPAPIANISPLEVRQSSGATCGSHQYSADDISNALNAGCNYYENGQTVGYDNYPHQYNDYEGFQFSTSSPWYEFPILADHDIFDGSTSPGADRVIFDSNCDYTAMITHTGASGNNFVECDSD